MLITSRKIWNNLREKFESCSENFKEHGYISDPFLRKMQNKYYLAFFGAMEEDEKIVFNKRITLCDAITGEFIGSIAYELGGEDPEFITPLEANKSMYKDDESYDKLYILLDNIRSVIEQHGKAEDINYAYYEYMCELFARITPEYQKLYKVFSLDVWSDPPVKEKAPEKTNNPAWNPVHNLSELPEKEYRYIKELSKIIEDIPSKNDGEIAFAYPAYCFDSDRAYGQNKYEEVLSLYKNEKCKSHFRHMIRDTIFVKCGNKRVSECMYKFCPYVMAAYYKYLVKFTPNLIGEQRAAYKEQRFEIDKNYYEGDIPYSLNLGKINISVRELNKSLKDIDSRRFIIDYSGKDELLIVNEKRKSSKIYNISKEEIESGRIESGEAKDKNGNLLGEEICHGIIVDYLVKSGHFLEMMNGEGNKRKEKREEVSFKTSETPNKNEIPKNITEEEKVEPVPLKKTEVTPEPDFWSLAENAEDSFYGMIKCENIDSPFFRGSLMRLQRIFVKKNMPLFTVFANHVDNYFWKYHPGTAVVFVASHDNGYIRQEYSNLIINEKFILSENNQNVRYEVFNDFLKKLKPSLISKSETISFDSFDIWYSVNQYDLPAERKDHASYISNLCNFNDSLIFMEKPIA